ncbi:MAG: sigma-70 family RNA polymerase sigma factor [Syntrophobacteraceae bacterium]
MNDLRELTKEFPFEPAGTPEASGNFQIEDLFTDVRKIALKAFSRIPLAVRRAEDKNDWIQDAFEILCKQTLKYKPAKSYYDVYIKDIVRRRLIDKQRQAYRNNPVADITCRLKPEMPANEIDNSLKIDFDEVQPTLHKAGPRIFTECNQEELENIAEDVNATSEFYPEKRCQDKELMSIVLKCLEEIRPNQRRIVIERYLIGYSYKEIARMGMPETLEAVRGQAKRGFLILKDCVLLRSGFAVPA